MKSVPSAKIAVTYTKLFAISGRPHFVLCNDLLLMALVFLPRARRHLSAVLQPIALICKAV